MKRSLVLYTMLTLLFGIGILAVLQSGRGLSVEVPLQVSSNPAPHLKSFASSLAENATAPLARLFLQLIIILMVSRIVGAIFQRIGQPAVVGEMAAGILLGPSLLGWAAPSIFNFVFPASSLDGLKLFSQIGVCLFLFVVGMELDLEVLKKRASSAMMISFVSILFPFFLGVLLALRLYQSYAAPGARFVPFALFMGIASSITAFPVLARILKERRISGTPLGASAIACAAINDVAAWCILAVVVAITRSAGLRSVAANLGAVALFALVIIFLIRPMLPRWMGADRFKRSAMGAGGAAAVLIFMLASAFAAEIIGIHALFGAFLAGVVMPPDREFRHYITVRIESFSSIFLLPLFFAFTGLRMQVGLLNSGQAWLACLVVIGVATLGKLGGTMLTARALGMDWHESFSLGALMNTRGLMELIALNMGYELGILSPQVFAIMVLMALVTTFMTGPLLSFSNWLRRASVTHGAETA